MTMQADSTSDTSIQAKIERLEASVNLLLGICKTLSEENVLFQSSNNQLMLERSDLQNKNDKVRGQVEAMVDRLKALDKKAS